MSGQVGVGGAWKAIPKIEVGVGGAWKNATRAWVGVAGAWKEWFIYGAVSLPSTITISDSQISTTDSLARLSLNSDGTYASVGSVSAPSGTWLTAGTASDWEARMTVVSGTFDGGTTGSWLNLGTTRTWEELETTNGNATDTCQGTLEIRDVASQTVRATATVTLTATVEV